MQDHPLETDVLRLLQVTALLWLGYVAVLAMMDLLFYTRPPFSWLYYAINLLNALLVLGLAFCPRCQQALGDLFLPLVIGLMSVLPTVSQQLIALQLPLNSQTRTENMVLRLLPMLLMALILIAWQYRWPHIIGFSVGMAWLNIGLHAYFYHPGGPPFLPPVIVVITQTVSFLIVGYFISTLITRLREQQQSLQAANTQLLAYASTLEDLTISRERNRLARELHDTLAHTLSALSVQLETAQAYWDVDPATTQRLLEQSLAVTRSGLQETRRALKSLRATPLDDLGLLLALRQLAEELAARANVRLILTLPTQLPALSAAMEQALYRIAQEALTNVAHHAHAHTLTVALTLEGDALSLRVQDDGIGFAAESASAAGHFGLPGMRERAELAGGQVTIVSQPGQGTTVQFKQGIGSRE